MIEYSKQLLLDTCDRIVFSYILNRLWWFRNYNLKVKLASTTSSGSRHSFLVLIKNWSGKASKRFQKKMATSSVQWPLTIILLLRSVPFKFSRLNTQKTLSCFSYFGLLVFFFFLFFSCTRVLTPIKNFKTVSRV